MHPPQPTQATGGAADRYITDVGKRPYIHNDLPSMVENRCYIAAPITIDSQIHIATDSLVRSYMGGGGWVGGGGGGPKFRLAYRAYGSNSIRFQMAPPRPHGARI